jgi:hypothetical protein
MGTVISNLKARFGVDTSDFKKGLKEGEQAMSDFKGAAGDQIDKFAEMFGVNMRGVNDSLKTASKSLTLLKESFIAAAAGGDILSLSAKILKWTLVSTGIGALVVLLGSVAAYFTKSAEGGGKFAKILAEVKAVFNDVIERFVIFGKGVADFASGKFKQGWQEMKDAFKGMGDEIREDVKAAGELAEAEEALKRKEIGLIVSMSERKAKIAELRQQAKEELNDNTKKMNLLKEAQAIIKSTYKDEIGLETERLKNMKAELDLKTKDPTLDQQKEIAEQQAKVNGLLRDQAMDLRAIDRELNTTIKTYEKEQAMLGNTKNIKMPTLLNPKALESMKKTANELQHTFIAVKDSGSALFDVLGKIGVDTADALNSSFKSAAEGIGVFLGELAIGKATGGDFLQVIGGVFAELAITVGKVCIAAAIAKMAIDQALITFGGAGVALAAGVALVAVGTAIKGSLKSSVGGVSSSALAGGSSGGQNFTYDNTKKKDAQTITIQGELVAKGNDLVYVFNQENRRRKCTT